ncbi:type III secretion system outer membrane ring subunit SctC [Paraburkholderia sp. IMGN_8]|uniref:type III secretion system outer membrane ring subunit SctC n=1 Tax=Paraburkholderia sp. IMGN_8 TaxID=3136564 RepID=UPI00310131BB
MRGTLLLMFALCVMVPLSRAHAAELQWRNRSFEIVANGRPLADFLRELAASQGTTAVIDGKVEGSISGRFNDTPARTLNSVCTTYGLTWYYDGSFLYIERAADAQTQVFPIPRGSASNLAQAMQSMQIADKRYPLQISDRDSTAYVSGPRRYVELVRQAIDSVGNGAASNDHADIRAFRLKYNWAADFVINRSGKEVTIPGVATILRKLYRRGASNNAPSAGAMRLGGPTREVKLSSGDTINVPRIEIPLAGMGGNGVAFGGGGYGGGYGGYGGGQAPGGDLNAFGGADQLPQIEADPAINAVLIRDTPDHMGRYASLIQQLDVKPRIVEINLTIMDISLHSLDQLGVDWRLHTSHGDFQFGNGANPPLTFAAGTTEAGQTGTTTPVGLALTASIGGSLRDYLLARINALARTGDAKLYSKPKVLTLDNTEAVLENLTEFYVQVQGFQDSSLYGITTGQSVKVTPLIVEDGTQRVMMSLDIQDGEVTNQQVSNVPVILQRNIVTKAMIDEGKSLLIAGFNSDAQSFDKTGIPLLSDIPWIGHLFKYTNKDGQHMERFYMITPRVVTPSAEYASTGGAENVTSDLMQNVVVPPSNDSLTARAQTIAPPPAPASSAAAASAAPATQPAAAPGAGDSNGQQRP